MTVSCHAEVGGELSRSATNAVQASFFEVERMRAEPLPRMPRARGAAAGRCLGAARADRAANDGFRPSPLLPVSPPPLAAPAGVRHAIGAGAAEPRKAAHVAALRGMVTRLPAYSSSPGPPDRHYVALSHVGTGVRPARSCGP